MVRANGVDPANCLDCYRLVTLGNNPMSLHRGSYVGAVVEIDFLSNPDVVETFIKRAGKLRLTRSSLIGEALQVPRKLGDPELELAGTAYGFEGFITPAALRPPGE